jgi:nicotinamidase/pyrazinamidase
MDKIIFWDIDTQRDFMEPNGKLYVPGAEDLKANLKHLTALGSEKARICGSVDAHLPSDLEFIDWPEHCVYGTPGQLKIPETTLEDILFVPSIELSEDHLNEIVEYLGQVIFEKQYTDVRSNYNVRRFIELVEPDLVVIYGVVSEICVNQAVEFFAGELRCKTIVVSDAIKELDQIKSNVCKKTWKGLEIDLLNIHELVVLLNS